MAVVVFSGNQVVSGEVIIAFPGAGQQEVGTAVVTVMNEYVTNANVKQYSIIPLTSDDHESLDDLGWDGVSFNVENIVDNVSFDIRAKANGNSWGNFRVSYRLSLS